MKPKSDTTKQPLEDSKVLFKKGQKVFLKEDTNVSQIVDDPTKDWSMWQPDSKEGLHTQGDLIISHATFQGNHVIYLKHELTDKVVCELPDDKEGNEYAELIVKAVNERKALLDALERARDWFYAHGKKDGKIYADGVKPSCIPYIETAINNAK